MIAQGVLLNDLCEKNWFRIVQIEVDVVAGTVDAAHRGIHLNGRREKAIAPWSTDAVTAFETLSFQRKKKGR